jgi:hypothetical protein
MDYVSADEGMRPPLSLSPDQQGISCIEAVLSLIWDRDIEIGSPFGWFKDYRNTQDSFCVLQGFPRNLEVLKKGKKINWIGEFTEV